MFSDRDETRKEVKRKKASRERERKYDKEGKRKDRSRSRHRSSEGRRLNDDKERKKHRERHDDKEQRQKHRDYHREKKDRHKDRRKRDRSSMSTLQKPKQIMVDEDASEEQMKSLLERLYDPSTMRRAEAQMSIENSLVGLHSLTKTPWELSVTLDHSVEESNTQSNETDVEEKAYPSWSYLDLRRMQNVNWATRRMEDGIKLAKESNWRQAENCYKEGLDLVPTHAELWVAYGCLCANTGRVQEGIDKLERALREDPDCPNAQKYLDSIRKTNLILPNNAPKKPPLATKSEKAMQDAIAEKAFLGEIQHARTSSKQLVNAEDKYPIILSDREEGEKEGPPSDSSASNYERKRKKRHRKHKYSHRKSRSKQRKHKYRHHLESSHSSDDNSCSRRRRHHRRGHRNRSRSRSKSPPNNSKGSEHT
mmetsp:Transcript_8159/g.11758  ORF Transcript_8159/g.11758 Transcript_8159/m.11758 type:complete len:423 (+) Transcript_8159:99-1367(+)